MKTLAARFLLIVTLCFAFSTQLQAQKERFQGIQGLGYLHTQVTILITNWETHPLSEMGLDAFEEEYKQHFLDEIKHDEEWVEFMLVEDNLLFQFDSKIEADVETAIEENLRFYSRVIDMVQDQDTMEASLLELRNELKGADSKLYDVIYPAICK